MPDFETRIQALDVTLLDAIASQSCRGDRRAWLAVQRAVRQPRGYTYLEIGSHLGGSLQQHVQDPLCHAMVSIDKRPASQPDERGKLFHYEGNSTARMLENLRRVAPERLERLQCIDADAAEIDLQTIAVRPDFCFIDGEHTVRAVCSDFAFCRRVASPNAAICLHDDWIVAAALRTILADLRRDGVPFIARKLSGVTFGIFLGDCPAARDPYIAKRSWDGDRWLASLPYYRWALAWAAPIAGWAARTLRV